MEKLEICKHVDHTLLKAVSTWSQIKEICETAIKYQTASVCIPPSFVKKVHETYPELNICTVIGFPLGYNTKEVKAFETKDALDNGASEIDMVINIGDAKQGEFEKITDEIRTLKEICGKHILKVIIETCYLTENEKIALCKCVSEAKADYIKTSTGFGTAGATLDDVNLFKKYISSYVKIKAAGGIITREDIDNFLEAGADRLGSSSAIKLLDLE